MATARVQLTLEQAQFINGINAAQARVARFGSAIRGMALFVAGGFAAKMGTSAATGIMREAADAAGRIESMTAAMSVFTGQLQTAKDLTIELMKAGAASPFGSEQYAKAGKALLGFGLSIEQMKEAIPMLSDVAAAVEANLDELAIVFGKNAAQGRLYTRDVNEFATRGIRIWQALADEINVPISKIRKAVEEGKVGTKEMFGAFRRLTSGGGPYQGMTEQFRRTFEGAKRQLEGAWFMLVAKMGEPLNRSLKPLFADVVRLFQGIEGVASRIGEAMANVVRLVRLAYTDWDGFLDVTFRIGNALAVSLVDVFLRMAAVGRAVTGRFVEELMASFANFETPPIIENMKQGLLGIKLFVMPILRDSFAQLGVILEGIFTAIANKLLLAVADVIELLPFFWSSLVANRIAPRVKETQYIGRPGTEPLKEGSAGFDTINRLFTDLDQVQASAVNWAIKQAGEQKFAETYGKSMALDLSYVKPIAQQYMKEFYEEAIGALGDQTLRKHLPEIEIAIARADLSKRGSLLSQETYGNALTLGYIPKVTEKRANPLTMEKGAFSEWQKFMGDITGTSRHDLDALKTEVDSIGRSIVGMGGKANEKNITFLNSLIDTAKQAATGPTSLESLAKNLWGDAASFGRKALERTGIFKSEKDMELQDPNRQEAEKKAFSFMGVMTKVWEAAYPVISDFRRMMTLKAYDAEYKAAQKELAGLQREDERKKLQDIIDGKDEKKESSARLATIVADSFARVGAGGIASRATPTAVEIAAKETAANTREIAKLQLKLLNLMEAREKAEAAPNFGTLN